MFLHIPLVGVSGVNLIDFQILVAWLGDWLTRPIFPRPIQAT